MVEWLSSWLAEQEVRDLIPGLELCISEIGYLLLPSRDMAEILLKRRKPSKQPTNQQRSLQTKIVKKKQKFVTKPSLTRIKECKTHKTQNEIT